MNNKVKIFVWIALLLSTSIGGAAVQAQQAGKKKISLEDITLNGTFNMKTIPGIQPMKDGVHYIVLEDHSRIVQYSFKTGKKVKVLFDRADFKEPSMDPIADFVFSNDESKILFTTRKKQIYRHSFSAEYYVYTFLTNELKPLSENGRQQVATFSPDGDRVAFVRENNIYVANLRFGTEVQVTKDGAANEIINGIPDWVYEEEFSFNRAFEWSPDSKYLAYLKFDERNVPESNISMYQGESPRFMANAVYPGKFTYKYPKAGEKNSVVTAYSYDIKDKIHIKIDTDSGNDQYIPRIRWTNRDKELAVFRLNREQNLLEVLTANARTGQSLVLYKEINERYIDPEILDHFVFFEDGSRFVVLSEKDGFAHLYLYDLAGNELKQITKGNWDVTDYYGYDPVKKMFYYQAARKSPMSREVYAVRLDGKKEYCLSVKEGMNHALFSRNFQYFINYFNDITTPEQISIYSSRDGKQLQMLENNQELVNLLKEYTIAPKEFFTFDTPDGVTLNGYMIKPLGFDSGKKYPVVMIQYSGPGIQTVLNRFSVDWSSYLAQQGFLVVSVDGRGTGARGEAFKKCTYMQLGRYESDDQIAAANYLSSLSFVDKERIAIWGWSYGGFISSLCLGKGADVFAAAIAVAPVTSWRFYDSAYTERYMGLPGQNIDGYDKYSPMKYVDQIKGRLLLIHGSADDNVHVQNAMELAEKLVQANVQFDEMIYTNRNHSIQGGRTRLHLYTKMTEFLNWNLKK